MTETRKASAGFLGTVLLIITFTLAFFVIVGVAGLPASVGGTMVFIIVNAFAWSVRKQHA